MIAAPDELIAVALQAKAIAWFIEGVVISLAALYLLSALDDLTVDCLLYTSPSPRDGLLSRMPSSA